MSALVIHTQALYSQVHVHTNTYTVHYTHTRNEGEVMLHISTTIKVEEWRAMEGEPQEEEELSVEAEGSRRSQRMPLLCRKRECRTWVHLGRLPQRLHSACAAGLLSELPTKKAAVAAGRKKESKYSRLCGKLGVLHK